MKTRLFSLGLLLFWSTLCSGQAEIKTMFYNVLNFSSAPPTNRLDILNSILSTYEPDLFMVCEVESQRDASDILDYSFQYTSAPMAQSPFLFNTSGASLIHQLVYYDTGKMTLDYTHQIKTNVRSINHYSFNLKTESNIKLEVFVAHFKASRGDSNVSERKFEAQQFINYLRSFPAESNVILAGDFNMYTSEEPGYQTLLNGTENLKLIDPINSNGEWHKNESFASIHTQSTRTSSADFGGFGAGGGLDDRFDMMLISDPMYSTTNAIAYINDSYKTIGNNANCFNNNINSLDCDGEYNQETREWLYQMSDHLPVVMKLSVIEEFLSTSRMDKIPLVLLTYGNLVTEKLNLKFDASLIHNKARIYNMLGQEVDGFTVSNVNHSHDVSTYASGLYFLKIDQVKNVEKFYINR